MEAAAGGMKQVPCKLTGSRRKSLVCKLTDIDATVFDRAPEKTAFWSENLADGDKMHGCKRS